MAAGFDRLVDVPRWPDYDVREVVGRDPSTTKFYDLEEPLRSLECACQ